MTAAAIAAMLVDVRNVNAHKCVRLEIHVPAEQAAAVMEAFGWPTMVDPVPVALARLQAAESKPEPVKDRKAWKDLPCSQQAAIRCSEPAFWRFLAETYIADRAVNNAEDAAEVVRLRCHVQSRSVLDWNANAAERWRDLERDYQVWLTVPA